MRAGGARDRESAFLSAPLRAALGALPERARAVVLLVAIGDLTYGEVAQTLEMEVSTAKSTYSRARAALRTSLTS